MGKSNKKKMKARDRRYIMKLEREINRLCDKIISNIENKKELVNIEELQDSIVDEYADKGVCWDESICM